jgi:hypothetical protein
MKAISVPKIPAPWHLKGQGYIFLLRFPHSMSSLHTFIPPALKPHYIGGISIVMLVDYVQSDAGPYRELLFIPGWFRFEKRHYPGITKIYVSTENSVHNGRQNWGIPKELATFDIQREHEHCEHITIQTNAQTVAEFTLQTSPLALPTTTALFPARWRTLLQPLNGKTYRTAPGGKGWLHPARLQHSHVDTAHFPDVRQARLIASVKAADFTLCFPQAKISEA